jgi:NAD(P)-dependent dehydrogenase (short-subunit alcohol dehydrogenase family)
MDLQGVSAIVTGGASGLGAATARRLAERGVHVVEINPIGTASMAARDSSPSRTAAHEGLSGDETAAFAVARAIDQHGRSTT